MANDEMWRAPDLVPSITYSDVAHAVEWLARVFGFRERQDARLSWPGGAMAWFDVGDSLFSIGTHDDSWGTSSSAVPSRFIMKVYVDDIDNHFAVAKSAGATIIAEPQEGFWGGRTYRALDHEGNRWEISQRGRDLAVERWQLPPGVTRGVSK
jgi:uncharacterized glyoxalase superfamily protein PhnB